jgi:cell division GTPase FtsZ
MLFWLSFLFDPELGAAVSVTVIATGFEQKRKPKQHQTIALEEDKDLDNY